MLTDLGQDILASSVAIYLDAEDIAHISLVCRSLHEYFTSNSVYHILYVKKFGNNKPTPLNLENYNWKELFQLRVSLNVNFYTWGASGLGRLGYLLADIPSNHVTPKRLVRSVHTPTKVSNFDDFRIDDIAAGGFTFLILTGDGSLFHTGAGRGAGPSLSPGPSGQEDSTALPSNLDGSQKSRPWYQGIVGSRRLLPGTFGVPPVPQSGARAVHPYTQPPPANPNRSTNPNLTQPPENLDFLALNVKKAVEETSLVTRLHLPPSTESHRRLVSISCGREHFIALDNYSHLYSWDTRASAQIAVRLRFPGLPENRITKIFAGWNLTALYMEDVGLIVVYSRDSLSNEEAEKGSRIVNARFFVIPSSKNTTDFVALADCVIFVKDGLLRRYDIHVETYFSEPPDTHPGGAFNCDGFNQWLEEHNYDTGRANYFTKLTGCYENFAVFTNDGLVLLGNRHRTRRDAYEEEDTDLRKPQIIPELQNKHIVHVVEGDWHSMALTDDGELLSWGRESNDCGCLGLGNHSLQTVDTPTVVPKPTPDGKWLAVCAAGWHSGGLFLG